MIKGKIEFAQTKSNKTILILVIKELQYIDVDWKYIKTVYKAGYSNNQGKNNR